MANICYSISKFQYSDQKKAKKKYWYMQARLNFPKSPLKTLDADLNREDLYDSYGLTTRIESIYEKYLTLKLGFSHNKMFRWKGSKSNLINFHSLNVPVTHLKKIQ